jgi:hypothetical protein
MKIKVMNVNMMITQDRDLGRNSTRNHLLLRTGNEHLCNRMGSGRDNQSHLNNIQGLQLHLENLQQNIIVFFLIYICVDLLIMKKKMYLKIMNVRLE